jgi:hypothetical protein
MSQHDFSRIGGALYPADDDAREWLAKLRPAATVRIQATVPRNPRFHRQFFKLIDMAYDWWAEAVSPMEYKGEPVLPSRERFRKDVVILAGFYRSVVNLAGEVRLEPESLSWSTMNQERFEALYSATLNVLLEKVFNGTVCQKFTRSELDKMAERILEFDT